MNLEQKINLIQVPDEIPQRGNRVTRFTGSLFMAVFGWRTGGQLPPLKKFVMIVAPHTSNMDFVVAMGPMFALGLRVSFMAKSPLFWEPFGTYLRWLGAVPIDRNSPGGSVREAVSQFEKRDKFILAITPEGTRKKVGKWKTGFYYIAIKAGVPIVPLTFDYKNREARFGSPLTPSGDKEKDIAVLKSFYNSSQARNPDSFE